MDSSRQILDKWQHMLTIVSQHSTATPDLARQFQKIFIYRLLAENILVFLLQYSGLMLSTLSSYPAPLWLASGTSCGFIFLRGYSVLPGIFAGSFLAYVMANTGAAAASVAAAIYSLQAFLLLWLCYRYVSPTLIFYRKITFVKFILLTGGLAGAVSLALQKTLSAQAWLANFNGIVVIACALIAFDSYFPMINRLKMMSRRELGFYYGLLLISIITLLNCRTPLLTLLLGFALLTETYFTGKRYGWCGAITAIFLLGLALNLGAMLGAPLFATPFWAATREFLQIILSLQVLCLLTLSFPAAERGSIER